MSHMPHIADDKPPPSAAPIDDAAKQAAAEFDGYSNASLFHALETALAEGDMEQSLIIAAAAKPAFAFLSLMAKHNFHQGLATIPAASLPVEMWLNALFSAAGLGHAGCVSTILAKMGADVKARRHALGASYALVAAALEGHAECAAILAPFLSHIPEVENVLSHCARMGQIECVKILGAAPAPEIAVRRAFFCAVHHGQAQCAEFLAPKFSGVLGRLALAATRRGMGSLAAQASDALAEAVSRNEARCIHLLLPLISPGAAEKSFCHAALRGRLDVLAALLPHLSSNSKSLAAGMAKALEFHQPESMAMIKAFQERLVLGQQLADPVPAAKTRPRARL